MKNLAESLPIEQIAGVWQDPLHAPSVQPAQKLENFTAYVREKGCQQRGTQELCQTCGQLASAGLVVEPVCRMVNDTIVTDE